MMKSCFTAVALALILSFSAPAARAAKRCTPCAGVAVSDWSAAAVALAQGPALEEEALLLVKRSVSLADVDSASDNPGTPGGAVRTALETGFAALAAEQITPWLRVEFTTPPPLLDNIGELALELETLALLARSSPDGTHFQIAWSARGSASWQDYAFLFKRAAVAVSGAQPGALVVSSPLPNAEAVRTFFAEEVAAYADAVALTPASDDVLIQALTEIRVQDPGAVVVVDSLPMPEPESRVLGEAARLAYLGVDVAMFSVDSISGPTARRLKLLSREFSGDVSPDPTSSPEGAEGAWAFVRGEDLSLRVIANAPDGADELALRFSDPHLRDPAIINFETGETLRQYGIARDAESFSVEIADPDGVVVLSLARMTAAELEGILGLEEEVLVSDTRQMPVEEILRRHQAFEDAQARKIDSYIASNTSHLRFQFGTTSQTLEATFKGPYFFQQGGGYDWVWQEFMVNGVRWKRKTIPEIPLVQPEKAAALPVEITFSKEYRYQLRGTEEIAGRDCWVVDFAPAVEVTPERTLYQGTVWIDREIYARVKTRTVQLGLEGEVISNEETLSFAPLTTDGASAPWSAASYYIPTRLVGQQIWSLLGGTTVVEREILLDNVRINPASFDAERQAALDSEATIVRDTEEGLKYLVVDEETGERVVKEEFDKKRRFLVGGVFYDENQDFPIPLAGMNWFWFDWRETGTQANIFFAGPLATVAISDPNFLGTKWDFGIDAFAFALRGDDTLFRDGQEATLEEVKTSNPNFDLKLGRPLGNFAKIEAQYQLGYQSFRRGDNTAEDFVLPSNHLNHEFRLTAKYNRKGYRFRVRGSRHLRGDWDFWGLPGNTEFEADDDTYSTWNVALGKTWHLPKFLKFGVEVEYLDGSNLDRFSKFDFGTFSSVRVRGYETGKIRADETLAAHLNYGWNVGGTFRLEALADVALATEEISGFDQELLAGVGVAGTMVGPWSTLINVDLGIAVEGPDDGVTATIAVLKLFDK
ncbi:MAG: hypothetical protein GY769_00805 [bacterium]|nr:hypothetical protein [bacterium]